eukprot:352153-Chlamydomonas_euryale.AAC.3
MARRDCGVGWPLMVPPAERGGRAHGGAGLWGWLASDGASCSKGGGGHMAGRDCKVGRPLPVPPAARGGRAHGGA